LPARPGQQQVDAYFESAAPYWRHVYETAGTEAEIFRARHAGAVAWIDAIRDEPGSRALDVGCGAGLLAVAMAQRGYRVEAIDTSHAMVDEARRTAASAGLTRELHVDRGDACALEYPDASFNLVVAIAVLPWLRRAEPAIAEMARVVKTGGHVILTADNALRLSAMLDPKYNPALAPIRDRLKAALDRVGLHRPSPYPDATFHRPRLIDQTLAAAGLIKVRSRTIGFGPFSVFGYGVVPEPRGVKLHQRLQGWADRGVPGLRATGGHYLVLAEKAGN
jgi:ubiquinone/menaquinone biosynthesis C-methylase UbiE